MRESEGGRCISVQSVLKVSTCWFEHNKYKKKGLCKIDEVFPSRNTKPTPSHTVEYLPKVAERHARSAQTAHHDSSGRVATATAAVTTDHVYLRIHSSAHGHMHYSRAPKNSVPSEINKLVFFEPKFGRSASRVCT